MVSPLPEKFQKSLTFHKLITPGDTVWVACSGGPDSTALFHLLHSLVKPLRLKVGLIHFNHQLRAKAAQKDEKFVRALARRYRVSFLGGRGKVAHLAKQEKYSPEEAARMARYDYFKKLSAKRRMKIATAHTQEDQAETILMRVFQGTGLRGLCGIRKTLKQGKLMMVRPLLDFSKKEILEYLKENDFRFCTDASNFSEKYLRNRIRLKLMPWLMKEIHPKITEAVARIPVILREDAELIETMEGEAWKRIFLSHQKREIFLSRNRFLKLAASLQFRILDRALRVLDPKSGLNFEAWQRVQQDLTRSHARQSLPKDIDVVLTPSKLKLYKK